MAPLRRPVSCCMWRGVRRALYVGCCMLCLRPAALIISCSCRWKGQRKAQAHRHVALPTPASGGTHTCCRNPSHETPPPPPPPPTPPHPPPNPCCPKPRLEPSCRGMGYWVPRLRYIPYTTYAIHGHPDCKRSPCYMLYTPIAFHSVHYLHTIILCSIHTLYITQRSRGGLPPTPPPT